MLDMITIRLIKRDADAKKQQQTRTAPITHNQTNKTQVSHALMQEGN